MSDYLKIPTSAEVWAVIHAKHKELRVFSSYSAPDGDQYGDHNQCVMMTEYGVPEADFPIIGAKTVWEKDQEGGHERINEMTKYWLCVGIEA